MRDERLIAEYRRKVEYWTNDIDVRKAEIARLRATKGTRKATIERSECVVQMSREQLIACAARLAELEREN